MTANILIYGHDPMLLDTRRLILEKAGYKVAVIDKGSVIRRALIVDPVSILILCQTLSVAECDAIIRLVRMQRPEIKTLLMAASLRRQMQDHQDMTFNISSGPRALVEMIHGIVPSSAPPRSAS